MPFKIQGTRPRYLSADAWKITPAYEKGLFAPVQEHQNDQPPAGWVQGRRGQHSAFYTQKPSSIRPTAAILGSLLLPKMKDAGALKQKGSADGSRVKTKAKQTEQMLVSIVYILFWWSTACDLRPGTSKHSPN